MNSAKKLRGFISLIWVISISIVLLEVLVGILTVSNTNGISVIISIVLGTLSLFLTYILVTILEIFADLVENTNDTVENTYDLYTNARKMNYYLSIISSQVDSSVKKEPFPKEEEEQ